METPTGLGTDNPTQKLGLSLIGPASRQKKFVTATPTSVALEGPPKSTPTQRKN
jgi:hypothetical protein